MVPRTCSFQKKKKKKKKTRESKIWGRKGGNLSLSPFPSPQRQKRIVCTCNLPLPQRRPTRKHLHLPLDRDRDEALPLEDEYPLPKDVYERLVQKGKKVGFFQLLATQTISAVWHGLYPGYIIFFVQSALMIAGSRVIYRWQQGVPQSMGFVKHIFALLNIAYTILVLNYSCVGFLVLSMHETIASYASVYYIGTIVPIVLLVLGPVIKPARPAKSKARKEE